MDNLGHRVVEGVNVTLYAVSAKEVVGNSSDTFQLCFPYHSISNHKKFFS